MEKMSEERIAEIQRELSNNVDKENDFLKEIEKLSASIAHRLLKDNHTRESFMGTEYIFNLVCDKSKKQITVMRTDPVKLSIGMGHYRPGIFVGEWDDRFTLEENVYVVVKAALCSKAGIINVEELN